MTHDELLSKIDAFSCCSGVHEVALLAVVELHKPFQFEDGVDSYKPVCKHCQLGVVGDTYPCETIQAIQSALQ